MDQTDKLDPIAHIRKNVLGLNQAAFAALAGATQATVSRWESGELEPDRGQLRRIKQAVIDSGAEWSDSWVFEVPDAAPRTGAAA